MKNRSTLSVIVLLLVLIMALVLILFYGSYSIASRSARTERETLEISHGLESELRAQSARSMQTEYAHELGLLEANIVEEDELVSLIESIEGAGRRLGLDTKTVSVSSDKPTSEEESENPVTIRIVVESKGEWALSLMYLRSLENLPTRISMEEANFTKEETESGQNEWKTRITLSVYVFK